MKDKEKKAEYFLEVAKKQAAEALQLTERVKKALEMGADDPSHKYFSAYQKLVDGIAARWLYHSEYLSKYIKEKGIEIAKLDLTESKKKEEKSSQE